MKGRSHHRLQSSDPPDDWVDGHWTVDCICGVNFDDGEEMVKCDECDVWVHTRCSRYVKGDDPFACDKCKGKSNRTDTEETEVAEVLAGLTTKTMRMKSSFTSSGPSHRPFKLWTDIPIEDRVHVQGIPGGDPSLFGGVSSVFSPGLWKCTGYIPKKFNFQYREFPNWDDNPRIQEENENAIDKGAGVLFSFSKESVLATSVAALVGMRAGEEDCFDRKTSLKEMNKCDNDNTEVVWDAQNAMKERSLLRPIVMHSGKRKKEDFGTSKDRSGKKRVKTSDKDIDPKRRGSLSSKTDIDPKIFKADTRSIKNKNVRDIVVQEQISDDYFAVDTIVEEPNNNDVAMTDDSLRDLYPDMQRHGFPAGHVIKEDKATHGVHAVLENSLKINDAATCDINQNSIGNATIKELAGDGLAVDNVDDDMVVRGTVGQPIKAFCHTTPEIKDNLVLQDFDCDVFPSSSQCKVKVKREGDDDNFRQLLVFPSSPIHDFKYNERPSELMVHDTVLTSSVSCENKVEDVNRKSEIAIHYQMNKPGELSDAFGHPQQELEGFEGSMETQKGFPEIKSSLDSVEESSKSGALLSPPKVLSCLGKSLSSSSITNSQLSGIDLKPEDTNIPNPRAKDGGLDGCNIHVIKECYQSDGGRDEVSKDEVPRKSVRERTKSSMNSNLKAIHSNRSTQNSVAKQIVSDSKDSNNCSSAKAFYVHQAAIDSGSIESNVLLHPVKASQAQNKISSSVQQRGEKVNQTNFQTSSKLSQSHVPSVNISPSSNSSAMLSDEELALLLHQELNSSPRVPRVPRARHAGSLPQLTSPSATSMLMKRTSSAGGKDHHLVSRRKCKDASREGLSSSHELDDEATTIEKVSSSCDQKKQDMAYTEAPPLKEEGHATMTAITGFPSSVTANSSPPSPPESRNLSSIRSSPRNVSDDDTRNAGRPVHRTLPGLINEIMSKGRRMTYEELCNAVLPHWHNLRKHNGERYAYSSHSQAVLDCLRNRHEWARLVDRGPKTNSNRKRRKLDADESEDNGYRKGRNVNETEGKNFELQKEEFPKGKRKARKRRRLALQGRAVKDVRKRRQPDSPTDEDVGQLSNSTEESMFSEDEIPCGKAYPAGSEASASSDEAGSE